MGKDALAKKEQDEEDPRERLKRKSQRGASNLVEQVLKQPEIQRTLLRQSLETGLVISALLVGIMTFMNGLKRFFQVDYQVDLALGVVLVVAFLLYVYYKMGEREE